MPPIHFKRSEEVGSEEVRSEEVRSKRSEEVRNGDFKLRVTNFELRMRSSALFNLRLST
jgi:hypothetical protein